VSSISISIYVSDFHFVSQSPTICLNDVVQRVSKGARSDECVGGYSSADNRKVSMSLQTLASVILMVRRSRAKD